MKRIVFIFLLLGLFLECAADYKEEILKLARIDLLSEFQKDVLVKQVSSYDTTGGNDDGFSGKYSYLRKEDGKLVIADLKGPGVIQRIWTPTPSDDTIQFYFDNETVPRIELKFRDLFSGKQYPFQRPVVGNEVGGYYCYLPIPYKSSCKIMYKGSRMQFFQIQYRETGNHVVLSSFPAEFSRAEKEALSSVIEVWENSGKNIIDKLPDQAGIKQIVKNVSLKAGETLPVFEMKKGGRIVGIEVVPQIQLNSRFKDLIFKAWWDSEPVAAIHCPFTDFFGYAFGKPSVRSLLSGVREDGTHYCYLPMPFDTKAKLELEFLKNTLNSATEIPVQVTVYYTEAKRKLDEGKFYAEWRREKEPESGKPYTILNKKGRGHYVGTFLQAQGLNPGMTIFFEGDDECYVDGELRLHGTGSEDYFNGGWYALADRWDQAYSLPLHGCMAYSIPLARTGGYRFKVTDKISFEKNISLSIEHGPENNAIPVDYTSVAFYYCDMPPVSNELPSSELLGQIETPDVLEYWIQLLPVRAMGHGTAISYENCKDSKSAKNYEVLKLQCQRSGFAKFELEVPNSGRYKLYISWLKGPDCGEYEVNQRQIPVKTGWQGYAAENTFVEREYIGTLHIEEGTNTITIVLKDDPKKTGPNTFLLHRIFLEKQ
jgi:hypothetical protein